MKRLAFAASLTLAAIVAAPAHAAVITDVNPNATRTILLSSTLNSDTIGQVFVPTEDILTGLGFRLSSLSALTTGTVTLSLYQGALTAGAPLPATSLFRADYSLSGLMQRGVVYRDLFSGSLAVTANTAYTAVLTGSSNVAIAFGNGEGYAPGYLLQTKLNDPICKATPGACDASFRMTTASATAAVPEPGGWAMMLGGFFLTGATLRRRGRTRAAGTAA